MTSRNLKVSDDEIIAALVRAMQQVPPSELTLALVAKEAGVTAGRLVQRFGSKRELLVRVAKLSADASTGVIDAIRGKHDSPLAALRDYATCMAALAPSPEAYLRNLAYLQDDLSDPELYASLASQARRTRAGLERLIADAIGAGELRAETSAKSLARALDAMINGSLMTWAFHREGTAVRWLSRDVDTLLGPFIAPPKKKARR